jgi:hypothetical protein
MFSRSRIERAVILRSSCIKNLPVQYSRSVYPHLGAMVPQPSRRKPRRAAELSLFLLELIAEQET